MQNITYFLGAGASANCLPIYSNFEARFKAFASMFKGGAGFSALDTNGRKVCEEIYGECEFILSHFDEYQTPDQMAYFFHHSKIYTDSKLKRMLIMFFMEQQISTISYKQYYDKPVNEKERKDLVDFRYKGLISHMLLPDRPLLPKDNYKIITWNYDVQLERALGNYHNPPMTVFGVNSNLQIYPELKKDSENNPFDLNKFGLVHLNGIAYMNGVHSGEPFKNIYKGEAELMKFLIELYEDSKRSYDIKNGGNDLLKFAWESYNTEKKIYHSPEIEIAKKIAANTNILIIIGYSFPEFNSDVDKIIFSEMSNLERVIIQDQKQDVYETVLELLDGNIEEREIKLDRNLDRFYMPRL